MTPLAALQHYWGHATFRPLQAEIIQAVLEGKDVLTLLPTGGGKSICFQVPTLVRPGLCLVISPLIALMKDQVDQLKRKGIAAEAIFSGMSAKAIDSVLDNCVYGQIKFLYVSPERLKTELLQARVKKMQINLLAVDEAHCISQWGYDFRPAYLEIAAFKALIPHVSTIALTATATPQVQQDIQAQLQLSQTTHFQQSFARHNLVYVVRKTENKEQQLLHILRQIAGTAIVYVNTRKKTQEIARLLQQRGFSATAYHAGLSTSMRTEHQEAWLKGTTRIMVATNAFGMGIDKPDVRLVIHWDLPTTLEAYYQEAGRAGRDEKKAYSVVLYDYQDVTELTEHIERAHPTIVQIKKVYQCLANYYQVAVGSHHMVTYDFDWEGFVNTYQLSPRTSYQALKVLEREGMIQLNEVFFQPAQLYIHTAPKALYAFQVAYATYDQLIKVLLRLYGGELFSSVHNISTQRLATLLKTTPQSIHQQLQALAQQDILQYYPQKDQPQLTFTTERYPTENLPLDTKALQSKKVIATQKAQAVIHYVTHLQRCRAQILLAYFGEDTDQQCGQCDICLRKRESEMTEETYQRHKTLILQQLQQEPKDLRQLITSQELNGEQDVLATIRQLLDQKEVIYNEAGQLTLRKNT